MSNEVLRSDPTHEDVLEAFDETARTIDENDLSHKYHHSSPGVEASLVSRGHLPGESVGTNERNYLHKEGDRVFGVLETQGPQTQTRYETGVHTDKDQELTIIRFAKGANRRQEPYIHRSEDPRIVNLAKIVTAKKIQRHVLKEAAQ